MNHALEVGFHSIFEENGSVMLLVEPVSGVILDANPAASAYYGYSREQLIGMPIYKINCLPPEEITHERQRALHEERNRFNFRHRLASGEERDVEVYSSPVTVDGRPLLFSIVHDITERRRTDEALRESLESLKEAQIIGSLGSYVLDIPAGVWTSSDVLDGIFGIDKEYDHTVAGWLALVHPDDRAMMAAYFADEVAGQGKPFNKEYHIVRQRDGAKRWVHGQGRLEFDAQGHPIRQSGVIQDITERKQAEMQLRDSEERYRSTFEQAAVGILHASFDGRILRCNARFAEILGYPIEEALSLTLQQVTAPEDLAETINLLREIESGATKTASLEKRYVRRDGSLTCVKLTASAQHDTAGRAVHYVAIIEDINARKAAEERLAATQKDLRASEERYRIAFQTAIDAININHLSDGRYIEVNQAFLDIMGYEREEVIGRTSLELDVWVDPCDRKRMLETLRLNPVCRNFESQFRKKNGEVLWGLMSSSVIELDGVPCVLSITRDITKDKAAQERLAAIQEELRASEAIYRTAFQTSLDAVDIGRLDNGMYIDVSEAFVDVLGYEREEVIGRTSLELNIWADPADRQKLTEVLRRDSICRNLEVKFRKKSGEVIWALVSTSSIEIEGLPYVLSVTRNISDVKEAEEKINDLAFYDPLTRLPNRRLFLDRLQQALAASIRDPRMRAMLFVDLDDFKTVNDTLGHRTGDLLLVEVAKRLTGCAREADTVARLGGDEFAVLLENLSETAEEAAEQARRIAGKIIVAVGQPFFLDGRECRSAASIGIALLGDERTTRDEALRHAEIAMFQAKAGGRNNIHFFSPVLQAAVDARATLERDLRDAIRKSQFQLYYQPQVEHSRLIGAEALIRWNHPTRGLLTPGQFIPMSEKTGQILPLGGWVLETACKQIAAWALRKETAHVVLAVNISARQFRQPGFVQQVSAVLDRTGADPRNLKLELTESMLLENIEELIAKMTILKSHGVRFSLDDFGTGYSSLAYLKRLPLDQLKIDRAFVHDILSDVSSGAIAQTIVSLGRAMGLSVIAEGVDNEEQRSFLTRLGCTVFQGFLCGLPQPLEEFERKWLGSAESAGAILQ